MAEKRNAFRIVDDVRTCFEDIILKIIVRLSRKKHIKAIGNNKSMQTALPQNTISQAQRCFFFLILVQIFQKRERLKEKVV